MGGGQYPASHSCGLKACYVGSLEALGSSSDLEFDGLPFIERPIAVSLNCGEVDEHVLAGLALDESETFARVEPLNCSLFFHSNSYSLFFELFGAAWPPQEVKKRGAASVDLQPLKMNPKVLQEQQTQINSNTLMLANFGKIPISLPTTA